MSQIKIFIDNNEVNPNSITTHYQRVSRPGGHNFVIKIPLSMKKIIRKLEELFEEKIDTEPFVHKILTSEYSNFYYVLSNILEQNKNGNINIQWVINNFNDFSVKDGVIYFKGVCSLFQNNF